MPTLSPIPAPQPAGHATTRSCFVKAVLASQLRPHARLLALVLAYNGLEDGGDRWQSNAQLAIACNLELRTIYRITSLLVKEGWLLLQKRPGRPSVKQLALPLHLAELTPAAAGAQHSSWLEYGSRSVQVRPSMELEIDSPPAHRGRQLELVGETARGCHQCQGGVSLVTGGGVTSDTPVVVVREVTRAVARDLTVLGYKRGWPAWCGECDPATRMKETDDGKAIHCKCHQRNRTGSAGQKHSSKTGPVVSTPGKKVGGQGSRTHSTNPLSTTAKVRRPARASSSPAGP